ncbi:tyrosine-type recombinase/integrase [Succinispira mobilis]|uniref:tyrosine-type recombinase/integrase n=1 Tax=Succinispira mobilis TaxID=78120 RepID=UPI0003744882|nr:site-specific integrase [Succinispira mobilis]
MAGSIKKQPNGKYLLTAYCGYDAKGKQVRIRKTIEAKSDREAQKKLALFVAEVENGGIAQTANMTLAEFADYWLEKHAKMHLADRTLERQLGILKTRILPTLGHLKIDKIKPSHVLHLKQQLIDCERLDRKAGKLSLRSVEMNLGLLRSMLNKAVKWKLISTNPCQDVDIPKPKHRKIPIYDEQQLAIFLRLLDSEPTKYKLMAMLALTTGLRRSEMFGLEWQHINFNKRTCSIEQSSLYIVGKGLITKEPKTELSARLVAAPTITMELFKQHYEDQRIEQDKLQDMWCGSNRVFTTWDGRPMHPDTFNTWLKKFIKKHNLPHISPHSFRHMSATFALQQGIYLKSVSSRLGHAKTSTTADIYAHALQSVDREIADKMDSFLDSINGNQILN